MATVVCPEAPEAVLPVSCGLLSRLPSGARPDRPLYLRDRGGGRVPAVFHRHRGGYLLHARLPPGPRRRVLRRGRGRPGWDLEVQELPGDAGLCVEGACGRVRLSPGGRVVAKGFELEPWPSLLEAGPWRVAHRCVLRVTCVRDGILPLKEGRRLRARLLVRLHAGAPRMEVGLMLVASRRCALPDGYGLRLKVRGAARMVSPVSGALRPRESPVVACWEGEGFRVPPGKTWLPPAPGLFLLEGTLPLWLRCPAARGRPVAGFVLEPGGALRILAEGGGCRLLAGEGRVVRAVLGTGGAPARGPGVVRPACSLKRGGGGSPLPPPVMEDRLQAVASDLAAALLHDPERGLIRRGEHAGDYRLPRGDLANLEYDTTLGLVIWALAGEEPAALAAARTGRDLLLARVWDRAGSGLFFPHGSHHRRGQVEPGHHWVGGLLLLEHAEPDPLTGPELERVLDAQLRELERRDLEQELPRSLGWGLLALSEAALWRRDDRDSRREIRRWRGHLLARQTGSGILGLVPFPGRPRTWLTNPFVQGGIILPALVRSLGAVPSASCAPKVRHLARGLARHAVVEREERLHLARRLVVPEGSGKPTAWVQDPVPGRAALFLGGLAAADPALKRLEPMRALLQTSLERLDPQALKVGPRASLLLRALPHLAAR